MKISDLASPTITLWHGGRNLESSYNEVRAHKGGRWEHGPGLYLTTDYSTAIKYAKGGGKLYKVTIRQGTNISDVDVSLDDVLAFVRQYVIGSKRKDMEADLRNNLRRTGNEKLNAEVLVNLCLNNEAIPNTKTDVLRQFLIDHGVDYSIVKHFGGSDETVVVVINPKIIKKVEVISSSMVKDNFKLSADFN